MGVLVHLGPQVAELTFHPPASAPQQSQIPIMAILHFLLGSSVDLPQGQPM